MNSVKIHLVAYTAKNMTDTNIQLTKYQRYYELHREKSNAKRLARYHNDPIVIAKKEERERQRAVSNVIYLGTHELRRDNGWNNLIIS